MEVEERGGAARAEDDTSKISKTVPTEADKERDQMDNKQLETLAHDTSKQLKTLTQDNKQQDTLSRTSS